MVEIGFLALENIFLHHPTQIRTSPFFLFYYVVRSKSSALLLALATEQFYVKNVFVQIQNKQKSWPDEHVLRYEIYLKILFSIQWLLCQTAINTEGFCFKNSDFPKMSLGKVVLLLLASAYYTNSTVSTFFNLKFEIHFKTERILLETRDFSIFVV